eukprot:TRINITY_DN758_c0_g1_i2.p1 TRINITY_DN758_c0_g1~~TRINITY_DN758_c0_g1_i2.p1  ORF type:complete len:289 (-),score=48.96 TRINITY_DN758_c0_g1_i2:368-1234(-)
MDMHRGVVRDVHLPQNARLQIRSACAVQRASVILQQGPTLHSLPDEEQTAVSITEGHPEYTASLVQESIQTRFQTASDLQHCKIDPLDVCILRGGALESFWNNSIAIDDCHAQKPPHYFSSYNSLYDAVESAKCKYAIVVESAMKLAIRKKYCNEFVIVGEPVISDGLSMLLPIGSNLSEVMGRTTVELRANQTEAPLRQYLNKFATCDRDTDSILSFAKLRFFFIIAFSFGGLIFVAMVLIPQHNCTQNGGARTCSCELAEKDVKSRKFEELSDVESERALGNKSSG